MSGPGPQGGAPAAFERRGDDSAGGRSSHGTHQLAAVEVCPRLWDYHYEEGWAVLGDKKYRLQGSLTHLCLAYYYASRMPMAPANRPPPGWFAKKDLNTALNELGAGHANWQTQAKEVLLHYASEYRDEPLVPFAVEEEFWATVDEIDPPPAPSVLAEYTHVRPDLRAYVESLFDPAVGAMRVTGRPDLLALGPMALAGAEVSPVSPVVVPGVGGEHGPGGLVCWDVDFKGRAGAFGKNRDKLEEWKDDGEFAIDWQSLGNLHVLRCHFRRERIKWPIAGVIIQRFKRESPWHVDRHVLDIPQEAYAVTPRRIRALVAKEREIRRLKTLGVDPDPNFWSCTHRYGHCFPPGTFVTGTDGPVPIEDIRPGDRALTHAGRFQPVTRTYGRRYEGPLMRLVIERRRGVPLTLTPEHPVLVTREEHTDFVLAGHVHEGDLLHVSSLSAEPAPPIESVEEAELLGLFLAEGNATGYVGRTRETWSGTRCIWSYGKHEEYLAERTRDLVRQVYGLEAIIKPKATTLIVKVHNATLALRYMREFGHRAPNKHVPARIVSSSRACVLAFLSGWMKGDGGTTIYRSYGTTSSKRMTIQWLALLAKHGIHPTVAPNPRQGGIIDGRRIERRYTQLQINFSGRALEAIGPSIGRPYVARQDRRPQMIENDVLLPVVKIEEIPYAGPVYNLETEGDHSYVADGFVVHNCDYREGCRKPTREQRLEWMVTNCVRETRYSGPTATSGGSGGGGGGSGDELVAQVREAYALPVLPEIPV